MGPVYLPFQKYFLKPGDFTIGSNSQDDCIGIVDLNVHLEGTTRGLLRSTKAIICYRSSEVSSCHTDQQGACALATFIRAADNTFLHRDCVEGLGPDDA